MKVKNMSKASNQLSSIARVKEFRLKLYPDNFDKMRSFYADILGYPVINEWNHGKTERGVMFDTGGAILELLLPQDGHKPLQGVSVSWEVDDVVLLWEEIKNKVPVEFEPRHNTWGDTSFRITDPEGLKITFFTKDLS